jgi:putative serine protease PepD
MSDQNQPGTTGEPRPDSSATAPVDPPTGGPAGYPQQGDPFGPSATQPLAPPNEDPFAGAYGTAAPAQPYGGSGWGTAAPTGDVFGSGEPPRRSRGGLVAGALVLALLAGAAGGVVGYVAADQNSSNSPLTNSSTSLGTVPAGSSERPDDSIAGIAARVLPTVVSIGVRSSQESGSGSGFVIDGEGYILTNNHVVAGGAGQAASEITVTFADGETVPARIVGRDTSYDLAVLKVDRGGLAVSSLGNSDAAVVGDGVVAVGSPLGLQGTVTTGIISAKDRPVTTGGDQGIESFISAIQTDAAINPGNSGGPLVDASGAVIGVNSAIASLGGSAAGGQAGSIGLGFAIPINQARRVAEEIIQTGTSTRPIIGASVDTTFDGPGARISPEGGAGGDPITQDGPADRAGLEPGDIVLKVGDRAVNGAEELIVAIRSKVPGEKVTLTVKQGDSTKQVEVTLGSASAD